MTGEVMISTQNLSKAYTIFKRPEDRLKQMLWRNRRKYYEEYWALRDASLEIRRGETVGLIGRNGSGKSTFLQLVCGTLTPTSGELSVRGRVAALLELGAGFNPEFTGRENVHLAASILGLDQEQIKERYQSIAEFAGIGDFIDQPVKIYSSGMYARLAFAVAAHVDADVLIVDEILAVGDAAFTQKCMNFIHRFRERGTLLLVSHDMASITSLCDRVVWLDSGMVRRIGPAKDVCYHYMAAVHGLRDGSGAFKIGGVRKALVDPVKVVRDPREELLQGSSLRNEIVAFDFDPNSPWFGNRGCSVTDVLLRDAAGGRLHTLTGGEEVVLEVRVRTHKEIVQPIVGFYLKDWRGQNLFGDNTYLTFRDQMIAIPEGRDFVASFRLQMPYLPSGDYAITIGVAEGTQADHVQHHWVDEALLLKVNSSHIVRGLVGIPILSIELGEADDAGAAPDAGTTTEGHSA